MNSTEPTLLTTIFDNLSTAVAEEAVQSLSSYLRRVIVTLGVIFNLLGAVGNVVILCVIARDKTLRKPYNALLASMAVNDIVICGVLNMIQVVGIYLGEFPMTWSSQLIMCRIHSILVVNLHFTSLLHVMVIAIHRYLIVYHQKLNDRITNKRTVGILICALHIVSFILLSGRLKPNNTQRFIGSLGRCMGKLPGDLIINTISITVGIAIAILLASYSSIYYKVYSSKKQLQLVTVGSGNYNNQRRRIQNDSHHKKILMCMIITVIVLVVGYVPGMLSGWMVNKDADVNASTISISMLFAWFVYAMCSVSYCILDTEFKTAFKRLFLCNNKIGRTGS